MGTYPLRSWSLVCLSVCPSVCNSCCRCPPSAGIVVALLGKELRNGSFKVEDYCFAGLPQQEESVTMETDQEDA